MRDEVKMIFYNGEFDPGSGWTLAAGLTHASRGAARGSNTLAATGGRVRNTWATCPSQGDNRRKRRLISHMIRCYMASGWKIHRWRIGSRDISLTAGQRPTVATMSRGSERKIPHTGTETRSRLLREAAVRNIGQWAEAWTSHAAWRNKALWVVNFFRRRAIRVSRGPMRVCVE